MRSSHILYVIGHVRYIVILTWLRGFRVKIANFWIFFCHSIAKRDLDTRKITPNIEVGPESLRAMLEYWYIERGLFKTFGPALLNLEYTADRGIAWTKWLGFLVMTSLTTTFFFFYWQGKITSSPVTTQNPEYIQTQGVKIKWKEKKLLDNDLLCGRLRNKRIQFT